MTAPRILIAAAAAAALAAASFATTDDALARGRAGGGHFHLSGHSPLQRHHFHLQSIRHSRFHMQRYFFTRYTPCVVWTRQGWTSVCARPR